MRRGWLWNHLAPYLRYWFDIFRSTRSEVNAYRCRAALSIALSPAIAASTWVIASYRKLCVYQPEEGLLLSCCSRTYTEVKRVFDVPVYFRWNERFIRYVSSVQEIIRLGWWNLPFLRYDSLRWVKSLKLRRMFKICYRRRTHYSYADFYFF